MEKYGGKEEKREQNLKRIILQLENLTAHSNSLPADIQYTHLKSILYISIFLN